MWIVENMVDDINANYKLLKDVIKPKYIRETFMLSSLNREWISI